jgi:hypothetical protein
MAQDLLPHIKENEVHPSMLDITNHSVSIGPATAKFSILSVNPPSAVVELAIWGQIIAACALGSAHPACKIGGSISPFKAELDLALIQKSTRVTHLGIDIPDDKIDYTLTLCAQSLGCKSKRGSISI